MKKVKNPDSIPVERATHAERRDQHSSPYLDDTDLVEHERIWKDGGGTRAVVRAWVALPQAPFVVDGEDIPNSPEMVLVNHWVVADRDDPEQMERAVRRAKAAIVAWRARSSLAALEEEERSLDCGYARTSLLIKREWELKEWLRYSRTGGGACRSARVQRERERKVREEHNNKRYWNFRKECDKLKKLLGEQGEQGIEGNTWAVELMEDVRVFNEDFARWNEIRETERPVFSLQVTVELMRLGVSREKVLDLMCWTEKEDRERVVRLWDNVTVAQAAALAGIGPGTWRGYVSRNQAPRPDHRIGGDPMWTIETVMEWADNRPGPGRPKKK
ncbi:hypothetical protein AB0G74_30500 [Streptomyces sp. NPDC020875]|uniref:hypothetical protein n=1 Tax=Streptomyces sp. NPDC020875 TaxID=3154898 RepID=UPI0034095AFA